MESSSPKGGIDRTFWLDAALLFALPLALFVPALLRGEIPYYMDTIAQFYPIRHHAAQLLHSGQLPFWNRTMFCGVPLLANPQWGLLYPLNWPFLAWPGPFWFTVSYPLHFAIGALGVYALVRKMTDSRIAGWAGALAFLFSTMTMSRIAFGAHHLALAWVPWAWLLLNVGWVSTHQSLKRILLLTCIITLQLLSGAPQVTFYALLSYGILALAVAFYRTYQSYRTNRSHRLYRSRPIWQPLAILFLSAVLGVMLAAPQLLPTWKLVQACDRGEGLSLIQVMHGALGWRSWSRALLGGAGFPEDPESTALFGPAWVALAVAAVLLRPRKTFGLTLVVISAVIYGSQGFSNFFYNFTPLYSSFHDPKRVLTIITVAISVLAGIGLAAAFDAVAARRHRLRLTITIFVMIALCLKLPPEMKSFLSEYPQLLEQMRSAGGPLGWTKEYVFPAIDTRWAFWGASMILAMGLLTVFWRPVYKQTTLLVLLVLVAAEAYSSLQMLDLKVAPAKRFFDPARAEEFPRDGRFFAFDTFARETTYGGVYTFDYPAMDHRLFPNAAAFYGLEDVQGYDAFKLKPYAAMMRAVNRGSVILYESHFGLITNPASPMVARLAVKYATGPADFHFALPGESLVRTEASADPFKGPWGFRSHDTWLEYKHVEPLVSFWGKAVIGDPFSPGADDPGRTTLILNPSQNLPPFDWPEADGAGEIEETRTQANKVKIRFAAPDDGGFVLLRDAFAPGWSAEVDGAEVPILLAEGMFRAVPVLGGEHVLVMRYWPPGLTLGLILMFVAIGIVGASAFVLKSK